MLGVTAGIGKVVQGREVVSSRYKVEVSA